jgi:hypothetical protein
LIVVDVDEGLKSVEEALTWAQNHGWPVTYTVLSGRNEGDVGIHFYFSGVRDVPDVNNPKDIFHDGVKWEIRYNSYVVIAGGLHKSGNWYRALDENQPVAPAPEFLQTYTRPIEVIKDERGNPNIAGTVVNGTLRLGDLNGKFALANSKGGGRHKFLKSVGGRCRRQGGNEDGIFTMLKNVRDNLCENPSDISDEWIRKVAVWLATRPIDLKLDSDWITPKTQQPRQQKGLIIRKQPNMGRYPLVNDVVICLKGLYGTLPLTAISQYVKTNLPFPVSDRTINRALKQAGWQQVGGRKHGRWQSPGTYDLENADPPRIISDSSLLLINT